MPDMALSGRAEMRQNFSVLFTCNMLPFHWRDQQFFRYDGVCDILKKASFAGKIVRNENFNSVQNFFHSDNDRITGVYFENTNI